VCVLFSLDAIITLESKQYKAFYVFITCKFSDGLTTEPASDNKCRYKNYISKYHNRQLTVDWCNLQQV